MGRVEYLQMGRVDIHEEAVPHSEQPADQEEMACSEEQALVLKREHLLISNYLAKMNKAVRWNQV